MTLISPEHRVLFDMIKDSSNETRAVVFTIAQVREMIEAIEGLDSQHTAMQAVVAERDQLRTDLAAITQERDDLRHQEMNFLSYGQGGADYWQSQYLSEMHTLEDQRDQALADLAAAVEQAEGLRASLAEVLGWISYQGYRKHDLGLDMEAALERAAGLAARTGGQDT